MTLPDYADWLTPERLEREESEWAKTQLHLRYVAALERLLREKHLAFAFIKELGCGTGWVPAALTQLQFAFGFWYVGLDRNEGCLELARKKNVEHTWASFRKQEIRETGARGADIVCAFAVLKHFRLDEWQALFVRLFSQAKFGLFTIPIAEQSKDDGTEFTHVWLSETDLQSAIKAAGHVELWRDTDSTEPVIATRKSIR